MQRVLVAGATGTIGQATVAALAALGYDPVCLVRPGRAAALPKGTEAREAKLTDAAAVERALRDLRPDGIISCLASRSGAPADAWAVDRDAQRTLMAAAQSANVQRFVLLSAICVQKPRLTFQFAKREAEQALERSGLRYSIVRPTAFFKSLSGQVARVRRGKPFLVFGDGRLTACKPISDRDCAAYLVRCLSDPGLQHRTLPIGGPGPAITPRDQGERLATLLGRPPRLRSVPPALLAGIAGTLGALGRVLPPLADRAEFARTGYYYATESMLVWDSDAKRYDADATPETGSDTLWEHYQALLDGRAEHALGAHAIFSRDA